MNSQNLGYGDSTAFDIAVIVDVSKQNAPNVHKAQPAFASLMVGEGAVPIQDVIKRRVASSSVWRMVVGNDVKHQAVANLELEGPIFARAMEVGDVVQQKAVKNQHDP